VAGTTASFAGSLALPATTADGTAGAMFLGDTPQLYAPGAANALVGGAGNFGLSGFNSTAVGSAALPSVTSGFNNNAVGAYSLYANTTGNNNVAVGVGALFSNTGGENNTALGHDALHDNTTGSANIEIGISAGRQLTTGHHNIAIGNEGVAGESGVIRVGTPGVHTATHLAGTVHGETVKAQRFEGDGSGLQNVLTVTTVSTTDIAGVLAWSDVDQTMVPAGLAEVAAIAAGDNHSVALKQDGTVVAWGDNSWGQTTVPAGLSGVFAVAAGFQFTVALKSDGTIAAWGFNWDGETDVPAGLAGVKAIAAGGGHSLALKTDGTVVAWGNNFIGQTAVPVGLNGVTAVAAGGSHSVALKNDGTVVAWGDDRNGQATVPAGMNGVTAIAAGGRCTVVLKQDGTVAVWGAASAVPAGLTGVVAIAAGGEHIVILKNDGTVVAWGDNGNGQATVPSGLGSVTAIAAGGHHSLALGTLKSSSVRLSEHINLSVQGDLEIKGSVTAASFNTTSDRHAKERFTPVDPQAVLAKVAALPITQWNFKGQPGEAHLGPMAQDFHAAFGLGPDERHIATVDADGVALAAIQGLNQKTRT
jgi:hypothetical protein